MGHCVRVCYAFFQKQILKIDEFHTVRHLDSINVKPNTTEQRRGSLQAMFSLMKYFELCLFVPQPKFAKAE